MVMKSRESTKSKAELGWYWHDKRAKVSPSRYYIFQLIRKSSKNDLNLLTLSVLNSQFDDLQLYNTHFNLKYLNFKYCKKISTFDENI